MSITVWEQLEKDFEERIKKLSTKEKKKQRKLYYARVNSLFDNPNVTGF